MKLLMTKKSRWQNAIPFRTSSPRKIGLGKENGGMPSPFDLSLHSFPKLICRSIYIYIGCLSV